jgi:hypothetical protein
MRERLRILPKIHPRFANLPLEDLQAADHQDVEGHLRVDPLATEGLQPQISHLRFKLKMLRSMQH